MPQARERAARARERRATAAEAPRLTPHPSTSAPALDNLQRAQAMRERLRRQSAQPTTERPSLRRAPPAAKSPERGWNAAVEHTTSVVKTPSSRRTLSADAMTARAVAPTPAPRPVASLATPATFAVSAPTSSGSMPPLTPGVAARVANGRSKLDAVLDEAVRLELTSLALAQKMRANVASGKFSPQVRVEDLGD